VRFKNKTYYLLKDVEKLEAETKEKIEKEDKITNRECGISLCLIRSFGMFVLMRKKLLEEINLDDIDEFLRRKLEDSLEEAVYMFGKISDLKARVKEATRLSEIRKIEWSAMFVEFDDSLKGLVE